MNDDQDLFNRLLIEAGELRNDRDAQVNASILHLSATIALLQEVVTTLLDRVAKLESLCAAPPDVDTQ